MMFYKVDIMTPLGYNNVGWFVDEVTKLENKIAFCFKNSKKDFIMTEKAEKHRNNICWFCGREIIIDKVGDHCHLTGKYRGPAYQKCNFTRKQSNFITFVFHFFINYDFHLFFKTLIDKRNDKVKFDIIPERNDEIL